MNKGARYISTIEAFLVEFGQGTRRNQAVSDITGLEFLTMEDFRGLRVVYGGPCANEGAGWVISDLLTAGVLAGRDRLSGPMSYALRPEWRGPHAYGSSQTKATARLALDLIYEYRKTAEARRQLEEERMARVRIFHRLFNINN